MRSGRFAALIVAVLIIVLTVAIQVIFVIRGSGGPGDIDADAYQAAAFDFRLVAYSDITGWRQDDPSAALAPFVRSCDRHSGRDEDAPFNRLEALGAIAGVDAFSGRVGDWRGVCERARALVAGRSAEDGVAISAEAARAFFEENFTPVRIIDHRAPKADGPAAGGEPRRVETGRFTGYFEPSYPARLVADPEFSAPALTRPDDLVMVDLGAFREELAGQRIAGAVRDGRLVPYPDHHAINDGVLADKAQTLAFMRPTDLLFLQIQGSGRLELPGGSVMRVGYAGQNGHPYTPVGRVLIEQGEVAREDMSMQAIRDWLEAAPADKARALREANASYVFLRELTDLKEPALGPLGADGLQLTPGRSLAVDRRYHGLGAPIFVSIPAGQPGMPDGLSKLFIAQDTGGAIRGPVRGDVFVGPGAEAGAIAGALNAFGEMTVLLPKPLAARISAQAAADRPSS